MIENWILPCSIKFYDVIEHFKSKDTIIFKRGASIQLNDIAYIYIGAPYSKIGFRCLVISDEVDTITLSENEYAISKSDKKQKYVQLKLEYAYEDEELTLSNLREHGLSQVQKQARVSRKLLAYIDQVNSNIKT